jgi:hypothetical protein
LVLSGTYNALSLVGTKADDVQPTAAAQFGLDPNTCTQAELISAFRTETLAEVRSQLLDMVQGLGGASDTGETLQRMLDLARNAPIHAVSSAAYNSMRKIGRSFTNYGLDADEETGVPGVLRHLRAIADEVGSGLAGRTASKRIEHLLEEITLFFRSRAAAGNPVVARAREALEAEVGRLAERSAKALTIARTQLDEKRQKFLGRLKPLFGASVLGVSKTCQSWQQIQWSTLRAIAGRDGEFKSPSSGRTYDLNGELTDPLMDNLPVAWEHYFTSELGTVRDDFALRLSEAAEDFCFRACALLESIGGKSHTLVDKQLAAFRRRVEFAKQQCGCRLVDEVTDRRRQLAFGMTRVAKNSMLPAYARAAKESGPGMKGRMLEHLSTAGRAAAPAIFPTMQADLTESLAGLEALLGKLFDDLSAAAKEQASLVAQNVTLDLDEALIPPEVRALLNELPLAA